MKIKWDDSGIFYNTLAFHRENIKVAYFDLDGEHLPLSEPNENSIILWCSSNMLKKSDFIYLLEEKIWYKFDGKFITDKYDLVTTKSVPKFFKNKIKKEMGEILK